MSFDKKETLITTAKVLSNPHKRIYPLSVILNSLNENEPNPIKAPRPRTSRPVKADELPNFMLEFLDQPIMSKKRPKSVIRERNYISNGFSPHLDSKYSRRPISSNSKRYASSTPTPSMGYRNSKNDDKLYNSSKISQQEFRYCPTQRSGKVYNPYMIHITPRSRLTLYSCVPINLSIPSKNSYPRSHHPVIQEVPNLQVVDYIKNDEPADTELKNSAKFHVADSFGDKLLRLKELSINEIIIQHKSMAAVLPMIKVNSDSFARSNFCTFPRSAIKRQELYSETALRYDRHGTSINGKGSRITFVDRILGQPLHTVVLVEAVEYIEITKTINCKCNLL